MKRAFHFISLALYLVMSLSCQRAPMISVAGPHSYTFTREGGTQSFTFTCNRDWEIVASDTWIRVLPASGTAGDRDITVTIKCYSNPDYDPRTASVTIKADEIVETITVNQETGIGFYVSPKVIEISNAEQTVEVEVQQNAPYSVVIDGESAAWIKQGGSKALTTDTVKFLITENTTGGNREGKILFKLQDGNSTETVTVRQVGTGIMLVYSSSEVSPIQILPETAKWTIYWGDGAYSYWPSETGHTFNTPGPHDVVLFGSEIRSFSAGVKGLEMVDLSNLD